MCIFGSLVSPSDWVDNNVPGPVKVLPDQDSPHATVSVRDLNSICACETKRHDIMTRQVNREYRPEL